MSSESTGKRWVFYSLLLLGFGIRLYGLTFHSLWLDESVSVHLASFPLSEILRQGMTLQEPNPPVYHAILALWMRVFGSGEAAVRALSAFVGTLYVPALYVLGKRLVSSRLALIGSLLATLNPFLVWYSQEARMYALVATLSLWALYCFVRALETPGPSWWLAYVVLTVASLYTHLYAAFLLPAELLFLLLYAAQRRRALWQIGLAWGLSLLCFAPWLLSAWQLSGVTPSWRPSLGLPAMVTACLEAFTVRRSPLSGTGLGIILGLSGLFALAGLFMPWLRAPEPGTGRCKRFDGRASVLIGLSLFVPFLLAYVLSYRQQIFAAYYLIIIVGPFLVALASGVDRVASFSRIAGVISLLLLMSLFAYGLRFDWSLEYRKEEWRAAARYVAGHAGPRDAVLCHVDYTRIPFLYYYRGPVPVFATWGGPAPGQQHDVAEHLRGLGEYETVWLVQSHTEFADPGRSVEAWLSTQFPVATEQYPPGVEVKGYAVEYRLGDVPPTATLVDAVYDGKVRLVAYEVDGEAFAATDDTYHPPSGWIHISLYWQGLTRLPEDYAATVRMIDDAHQVWGGELERPAATMRFYPSSAWQPGEVVRDEYDINLNPATPEGVYHLQVSLLSSAGEPLPALHGGGQEDAVLIGRVRIVPS